MASEKNVETERKFDVKEIIKMIDDPNEPFDFDLNLKLFTEHRIKQFEKDRLLEAKRIIYDILSFYSYPDNSNKQAEISVNNRKHPLTNEENSIWIATYVHQYIEKNYNVGVAESQSSFFVSHSTDMKTIIIKPK